MIDPAPITNEAAKAFFRESFDVVNADDDRSWRTAFVSGLFLPTDVARREAIIRGMPAVSPRVAAAMIRAMGEFDGASALGKVKVVLQVTPPPRPAAAAVRLGYAARPATRCRPERRACRPAPPNASPVIRRAQRIRAAATSG
jgi:hypothetical protein